MQDIIKEKLHISWKLLAIIVLTIVMGAIIGYTGFVLHKGKFSLTDQLAYYRYDTSGGFGQFSVFMPSSANFVRENVDYTRYQLVNSLKENGIEEDTYEGRLYVDAYYGESELTVELDTGKSAKVKAKGVGGDYFYFHPLELVSGTYFTEDFLNDDYVLIDRECAWALFGATDVEGFWVNINGELYVIAGVYNRPDDELNKIAGNADSTIYMSYSAMDPEGKTPITCYEVVMPDPVKNFGLNMLNDKVFADVTSKTVVCNSKRYTWPSYWNVLQNKRARKMRVDEIAFPYWENIARDLEDRLSGYARVQWICMGILATVYVVSITAWIIKHKPDRESVERMEDWFGEKTRKK